jgi:acyl-coenzyme A thioesterase PaaI-like protein
MSDGRGPSQRLAEHGICFVCGSGNPHGIGAVLYQRTDGSITAEIEFSEAQQGPPGFLHGGASAAVLDEAMGAAVWRAGYAVALVKLVVDYSRPVPLAVPSSVRAWLSGREGRTLWAEGEIRLADGRVAVLGRGEYVEAPHLFAHTFYKDAKERPQVGPGEEMGGDSE